MEVTLVFSLVAAIMLIGFLANYCFKLTKVPDLIWLLGFGLLIGPVLHLVEPAALLGFLPFFSALALMIILFDGGTRMNIYKLLREMPRGSSLALFSFIVSSLFVALTAHWVIGFSWVLSLLLGSIIGGTSSAIVVPIVAGLKDIREPSSLILDIESIITDPLCIVVGLAIMQMMSSSSGVADGSNILGLGSTAKVVVSSLSIGVVLGFIAGVFWLWALRKIRKYEYHYMLTIGFLFFLYSGAEALGGVGAIACLILGLILGNAIEFKSMLRWRKNVPVLSEETKHFNAEISFFVRTFFFVLMGMMVSLTRLDLIVYGVILTLVILLGRVLVIRAMTWKSAYYNLKEKKIMTFMIPRGLAPAVLAPMPFIQFGIQEASGFTEMVFSVVLCTAVIATIGIFATESMTVNEDENAHPEKSKSTR